MTMDCTLATEQMLEASSAELRGTGDSSLARHLASCAECRAHAAIILQSEAALHRGLDMVAAHAGARRAPRWRRRFSLALPPLAAAAVLGALWLASNARENLPDGDALYAALNPEPPVVDAGARAAVVMRDEARSITIVWLTQTSTEKQP